MQLATGEPQNTASEWLPVEICRWSDPDDFEREFPQLLSDNFIADDRRCGIRAGPGDANAYSERLKVFHTLGNGHVSVEVTEVIAVRGDRAVLAMLRVSYENGFVLDGLNVFCCNASATQLERAVVFDPEDLDAALAELESTSNALESP